MMNFSSQEDQQNEEKNLRARQIRWPAFMPFFWLGLAAVLGSFASEELNFPWYWWAVLGLGALLFTFLSAESHKSVQTVRRFDAALALAAFALTAMLYQLSLPQAEPDNLLYYHNKGEVKITALVIAPPEMKQNSLQVLVESRSLRAEDLAVREPEVQGKIIFYLPLGSDIHYGDLVEIKGELLPPDEGIDFSWREYLKHQGVCSTMEFPHFYVIGRNQGNPLRSVLYRLRENGGEVLSAIFPSPEDSLLKGILLGDDSTISSALEDAYRLTGTSHIIAISGFNMSVLAGLVSLFFTRQFGRKRGAFATILLLGSYSLLVGASASVVRAAFMGSYAVLGNSISRKGNTLNNLGVSALLMVVLNPHLPWDLGFQFSVMATLGLSLFAGPLRARLEGWMEKRLEQKTALVVSSLISETFLLTMIAQALVLPLSIWHFREVSWLFLIANPLILPVQPVVMILGLAAMSAGLAWLPLGRLLAWVAWPWVAYSNRIVLWLAGIAPENWALPKINLFWVISYYLVLFLIVFRPKPGKLAKILYQPQYLLPALAGLTLVVWLAVSSAPDGKLHITIPNEDGKNYVFITAAQGQTLLVAGSAGSDSLIDQVTKHLPLFSNRLDSLVIPNCGRASLSGLFVLTSKLEIRQVLWGCDPETNQTSRNLFDLLQEEGSLQTTLTSNSLLSDGQVDFAFQTDSEGLIGLSLEYSGLSAGLLMPGVTLEEWQGEPLCESLTAASQPTSLYLTCSRNIILSENAPNSAERVKSNPEWSELICDGSQILFR